MTGLTLALRQVGGETGMPLPAAIAAARPPRRVEYVAGRMAAQVALHRLTGQAALVGMGPDRLPVWPEGIIGSISHNRQNAVALAACARRYHAVGVDIETLMDAVTAREVLPVLGPVGAEDPLNLTLAFSAKESLFKALYPHVGFFGFEDARFDPPCALVLTRDLSPDWPAGRRFTVNCRIGHGRVLTWVALQARNVAPPSTYRSAMVICPA
ncbi:4'-phosphopantetheinyl transferase family protein [Paracoccus methylarcula]|uniref:4'-phosphopantetheinyl transferase family protein n=1 Tax=Paracoccus methylarcula TaxID=72022 RepID=UPI0011CDF0E0|nr:4'-phosphopantetheinyl transferase superfamily protein [Paracoccus methylarcula]